MNARPEAAARKDRRARIWLMLAIVIGGFSVVGNVCLGELNLRSQEQHHSATARTDAEIVSLLQTVHQAQLDNHGTLTEIKALATAVNSVISKLPAADSYLAGLAMGLEGQIQALCSATHANCPPLTS